MTSEVLMLNKDAVVIAADSAVTTGRDPHPRYSKAANKIFDLTIHGGVAVTIFAAAEIDRVPWELALKQYRKHDAPKPQLSTLRDYVGALVAFLQGNPSLFPGALRTDLLNKRFFAAARYALDRVGALFPDLIDSSKTDPERLAAWGNGQADFAQELATCPYVAPFTTNEHQTILAQSALFQAELAMALAASNDYRFADVTQLIPLAAECLVKKATEFLNNTGLVFAGYGADDIFPSFVHIEIYGHIGDTLLWSEINKYSITHDNDALILPFAQSSMIDRFTDGFDNKLSQIINKESIEVFNGIVSDLVTSGITIPNTISDPIVSGRHKEFMKTWRDKNWEANFHPLRRVLNSLSVSEMGHLAESLLVLEELRERVTSPSESVGGPIDVAVVTKAEGLIWLKRKHYFDASLNPRYSKRTDNEYN